MDLDVLAKHARDLMGFKGELETAMPEIRKAAADASSLADDIASIKQALGPALEWIAEQQKAIEAAKAAEQQKADDAAKAHQVHDESVASKDAAEVVQEPIAEEPAAEEQAAAEEAPADQPAAESSESSSV